MKICPEQLADELDSSKGRDFSRAANDAKWAQLWPLRDSFSASHRDFRSPRGRLRLAISPSKGAINSSGVITCQASFRLMIVMASLSRARAWPG